MKPLKIRSPKVFVYSGLTTALGVLVVTFTFAATNVTAGTAGTTGNLASGIKNSSGAVMCLDDYKNLATNYNPVNVYPCSKSDAAQKWTPYSDHTIRIHGKCLEVAHSATANGSGTDLYTCNGSSTQKWTVGTNSAISLNDLVGATSGKCLDVYQSSSANNAHTDLWSCNGTTAQSWGWVTGSSAFVPGGNLQYANCHGSIVGGNYCYFWVQSFQKGNGSFHASGVSADMTQAKPVIGTDEGTNPNMHQGGTHSVMEIWAASANGKNIIEIGWISTNATPQPQLFVTAWVNGAFKGYNKGSGFVSLNGQDNSNVAVGAVGNYKLVLAGSQWQVWYNGAQAGYFPTSLWASSGGLTSLGDISVYGEVAADLPTIPRIQMGNGILGSKAGAIAVSHYSLIGSSTPAELTNFGQPSGETNRYAYGNTSATGFSLGGPGW